MSDSQRAGEWAQASLRQRLRLQLEQLRPPLQIFAESVIAEGSRIDLVARDPLGGVTLILIGETGDDLALFTRSLAHCSWIAQRIPDWLQLAPELELTQDVHALLLCPSFRPETVAAARSLAPRVELSVFRELPDASGLLLEPVLLPPFEEPAVRSWAPRTAAPQPSTPPPSTPPPSAPPPSAEEADRSAKPSVRAFPARLEEVARPQPSPARPSEFRSGLSEADLQLTAEEIREFD